MPSVSSGYHTYDIKPLPWRPEDGLRRITRIAPHRVVSLTEKEGRAAETRWVSYGELASARGISRTSAARMAFRRGWNRRIDGDGETLVEVPLSALPDDRAPSRDDLDRIEQRLEAESERLAALARQLAREREARVGLERAIQQLRKQLDSVGKKAGPARARHAQLARPHSGEIGDAGARRTAPNAHGAR